MSKAHATKPKDGAEFKPAAEVLPNNDGDGIKEWSSCAEWVCVLHGLETSLEHLKICWKSGVSMPDCFLALGFNRLSQCDSEFLLEGWIWGS